MEIKDQGAEEGVVVAEEEVVAEEVVVAEREECTKATVAVEDRQKEQGKVVEEVDNTKKGVEEEGKVEVSTEQILKPMFLMFHMSCRNNIILPYCFFLFIVLFLLKKFFVYYKSPWPMGLNFLFLIHNYKRSGLQP